MKIRIGRFDPDTLMVDVTFRSGAIVHRRTVNACLDAGGGYDKARTAQRVAEVAQGVAAKIASGAIA